MYSRYSNSLHPLTSSFDQFNQLLFSRQFPSLGSQLLTQILPDCVFEVRIGLMLFSTSICYPPVAERNLLTQSMSDLGACDFGTT